MENIKYLKPNRRTILIENKLNDLSNQYIQVKSISFSELARISIREYLANHQIGVSEMAR